MDNFFSVLPIGIQSNKEKFREKIEGVDPGAPNNPKIAKKFLTTTIITSIIFYCNILSCWVWFAKFKRIFTITMHLSKLFIPITRDIPTEAKIKVSSINATNWND